MTRQADSQGPEDECSMSVDKLLLYEPPATNCQLCMQEQAPEICCQSANKITHLTVSLYLHIMTCKFAHKKLYF